jgi:hypothetical protein
MSMDQSPQSTAQNPDAAAATETPRVQPETDVPDDANPVECPYCDRPFPRAQFRDLHLGEAHESVLTEDQREAYENASDEEGDDLFVFHLLVIGGIVALYAIMVVLYMVVLGYQG